tara:strand:+ start:21281 stop:22945 length:1665 start_codon:yes stop_codon:yes gene_type:complete
MELAVRFAVILGLRILVPAASYQESDVAGQLLGPFLRSDTASLFKLLGGGSSLEEFRRDKLEQYRRGSAQYEVYSKPLRQNVGWERRKRSATHDITNDWLLEADNEKLYARFHALKADGTSDLDFERAWRDVPGRLGKDAFIVPHVTDLLPIKAGNMAAENALHNLVNRYYFGSYAKDYQDSAVFQNMAISTGDVIPSANPKDDIDFAALLKQCRSRGLLAEIKDCPIDKLETMAFQSSFEEAFRFSQTDGYASMNEVQKPQRYKVDLAILTALPKEREAVEMVFGEGRDKQFENDPHVYKLIDYEIDGMVKQIAVAVLSEMGNTLSGVTSTDFMRSIDAAHTVMVGIAGGCPLPNNAQEDVRLGDVVIGQSIMEIDFLKRKPDGSIEYRDSPQKVSYSLTQMVRNLQSHLKGFDTGWVPYRDQAFEAYGLSVDTLPPDELKGADGEPVVRKSDPRRLLSPAIVHFGRIGAGDTLLKDPTVRDELRAKYSILAVEMESAGLRDAGWSRSQEIGVVRAIVDYCDGNKDDRWHIIGALNAAAVTRLLFEKIIAAGK